MFFADTTGFFSLICLMIQCGLAWIFASFFGVLAPGRAAWLYSMFVAFVGLGVALTSVSVRFTAEHHVAGVKLADGDLMVRGFYGIYLAGKTMFFWGLVRGVGRWRGRVISVPSWLSAVLLFAGFAVGFGLPTIESVLLVQTPFAVVCSAYCATLLHPKMGEAGEIGRLTVQVVLWTMALLWLLYGIAVLFAGATDPQSFQPLGYLLRFNSLLDLVLQVVLASGLIIAVMTQAQRQIVQAQKEGDRLRSQVERDDKLRAMATLVSGVAHEINNPLTAILGFADDLESENETERKRAVNIVREQAERCQGIVQRMSLLGRRRAVLAREFDVKALVERVIRGLGTQIEEVRVDVRADVESGMTMFADVTGFEQVITNLLSNALHVSQEGDVVKIRAEAQGKCLVLTVTDQGNGVAAEDRKRIFEPFWTTKMAGRGTGLGLAVVDAIVHAHGGEIEVGDAPQRGAEFTVRWPWRPPSSADTPAPATRNVEATSHEAREGDRLLIVDDEQTVRSTIRRHAERRGWQVVEAADAERALELLFDRNGKFAAIVCDLRMPGMGGIAFHDRIQERAPEMLPRVLFVTGDLASQDAAAFAERCQTQIVTKPFVLNELFGALSSVARVG